MVEYLRRQECERTPIDVCEGQKPDEYGYKVANPTFVDWDIDDCYFRDTFILQGKIREIVKEKDFRVCYENEGFALTIRLGSVDLNFSFDTEMDDHYEASIQILGWEIEEKDDCTILKVDLRASVCTAGLNKSDGYDPYD